jgi:prepilin-type N-terminal cleavage/methylation domain-containing protein
MTPLHSRSRGFTLIELLVVMSIIATLAGLAIVGVPAYFRQAQKTKCQANLKTIHAQLLLYEIDHKAMPSADGSAFVLAIWGKGLDKNEKEAQVFFCPSTSRQPPSDLSEMTPAMIDYTGPDQSSQYAGRNRLSSAMANASEMAIVSNKIPNADDPQQRQNQPHAGKGFHVLYLNGSIEWVDASRFPDDLPVIGPESPIEKFRILRPGFDG